MVSVRNLSDDSVLKIHQAKELLKGRKNKSENYKTKPIKNIALNFNANFFLENSKFVLIYRFLKHFQILIEKNVT